jgi:hypothetical protein
MTEIATVTSPGLNIHEASHAASHISDTLTTGDTLEVVSRERNWLNVRVVGTRSGKGIGQVGWVDGSFVSLSNVYDPLKKKDSFSVSAMVIGLVLIILAALAWLFVPA